MLISVNRDITPPSTPSAVTAVAQSSSTILVTWAAAVDTVSGVAQYVIYRSTDNITYSTVATLSGASLAVSYMDTGLIASTLYYYKVQAIDASGNSSAISASGSATTPAVATVGITSFTLSNGGADKAWTIGHLFKQGDVPTGSYITATGSTAFQAEVRNRWPDGSVKFAALSGIGGTTVQLLTTTTSPASGEVAIDPSFSANVTFTGTVVGTYSCPITETSAVFGANPATHTDGMVRKISGPVMTERHYYVKTSDVHIRVWFYVRSYINGATEVETLIENGWLQVTGPTVKNFVMTMTVGGTQRGTATPYTLFHHRRMSRVDWVGTDPQITLSFNPTYWQSTRVIPNFTVRTPTVLATRFGNTYTNANQPEYLYSTSSYYIPGTSAGGETEIIGLFPQWSAFAWCTGDTRAINSAIFHHRFGGYRYAIHYRDELDGRPVRPSIYPLMGLGKGDGLYYGNALSEAPLPTNTGDVYPGSIVPYTFTYDQAHQIEMGFTAYLLTARWLFMEEAQFQAGFNALSQQSYMTGMGRRGALCIYQRDQPRGQSWCFRALAQALIITPDYDTVQKNELSTVAENNIIFLNTERKKPDYDNLLGILMHDPYAQDTSSISGYAPSNDNEWEYSLFMWGIVATVWGWVREVGIPISSTANTNLNELANFTAKVPISIMGTNATFNYRRAGAYKVPLASSPLPNAKNPPFSTWYTSWSQVYNAYLTKWNLDPLSDTDGGIIPFIADVTSSTGSGYYLASPINSTDTNITLTNVSNLPTKGVIELYITSGDGELIKYNGITGNTLTGCVRGCGGTTARAFTLTGNPYNAATGGNTGAPYFLMFYERPIPDISVTNSLDKQTYAFSNLMLQAPALSFAVNAGVSGAQEAWNRFAASSTFIQINQLCLPNNPKYGIVPR